jgi:hypothetical protein
VSRQAISQPTIHVNSDPSQNGPGSLSVGCLGPDLLACLRRSARPGDLLKSIFRVTVAQDSLPENTGLPDVSGRYLLLEDEVQFFPHFPFERGMKYRFSFDPRSIGEILTDERFDLEFLIPSEQKKCPLTQVRHIFPSSDCLPENLLRFYVCFSNPMQRGLALEQVSLLDSDAQPVADALYRPPLELWDRSMQQLTVLLDPGRLKRRVGPNVALGPPLKAGQRYTLEIGSGMTDMYGRLLHEPCRKHFIVGDPVRECISIDRWTILPPAKGSREALALSFPAPLDWALLFHAITIRSTDGSIIEGQVGVDQSETLWRFIPASPWSEGEYHIRVGSSLEDVCGNTITGAFDRPLQTGLNLVAEREAASLTFRLV